MRDETSAIRALGAELVVVGSGEPRHAEAFRNAQGLDFPLVVDPDLAAYRAAGLRRGVCHTLGPASLAHAVRAWRKGFRQGAVMGDPWQNGGVFVVRTGGELVWRHVSREAGDHPKIAEILAHLRKAV